MNPVIICKICEDEINLNDIQREATNNSTGAMVFFTGIVRGETRIPNPHETRYLEYEAYQSMAEKEMTRIAGEIQHKWDEIESIIMIQKVGKVYPGEIAVVICCTASHRDSGVFEAARYGIDRLKEIVPVWKKEYGSDGETWVGGDYFSSNGK